MIDLKDFRKKSLSELENELLIRYKNKLKLFLEKSNSSEFKKSHILRDFKKDIAKILTLITEKHLKNE